VIFRPWLSSGPAFRISNSFLVSFAIFGRSLHHFSLIFTRPESPCVQFVDGRRRLPSHSVKIRAISRVG